MIKGAVISIITFILTNLLNYWLDKRKKLDELKINKIDKAKTTISYLTEVLTSYETFKIKQKEYYSNIKRINLYIAQFREYEEIKILLRDFKQYCGIIIDNEEHRENIIKDKKELESIYEEIIKEFNKKIR